MKLILFIILVLSVTSRRIKTKGKFLLCNPNENNSLESSKTKCDREKVERKCDNVDYDNWPKGTKAPMCGRCIRGKNSKVGECLDGCIYQIGNLGNFCYAGYGIAKIAEDYFTKNPNISYKNLLEYAKKVKLPTNVPTTPNNQPNVKPIDPTEPKLENEEKNENKPAGNPVSPVQVQEQPIIPSDNNPTDPLPDKPVVEEEEPEPTLNVSSNPKNNSLNNLKLVNQKSKIVIVIDTSGSMNQVIPYNGMTRLNVVKNKVLKLIDNFKGAGFMIVSADDLNVFPPNSSSSCNFLNDVNGIKSHVDSIKAESKKNFHINKVLEVLKDCADTNEIIILTDGGIIGDPNFSLSPTKSIVKFYLITEGGKESEHVKNLYKEEIEKFKENMKNEGSIEILKGEKRKFIKRMRKF